jgi:AraC-like DNA-binding protein
LLDTARPYQVLFPQLFRQSILRMPDLLFRDIAPRGDDLAALALPGREPLTVIARQNLLSFERCAGLIEPAFLSAAANCAIDHLALAMRATLRGDSARRKIVPDHVVRAEAWITRNLHDAGLSVEGVARSVGLSPGHLQQLFRSATGLTVADAIRDRRLANCRKELADSGLGEQSITEIAFRWGFSESSSFSRAFRRAFGVSPRQFRKQSRLS